MVNVFDSSGLSFLPFAVNLSSVAAPAPPSPPDPTHQLAPKDRVGLMDRHTTYSHSVQGHKP